MNILILCTYPISQPRHGGQIRVKNIAEYYRSAGHNVQVAGVLGSEQYKREDGFADFPGLENLKKYVKNPFLMEDFAIAMAHGRAGDDTYINKLSEKISIKPDLIHVEQPWLFEFAEIFRARGKFKSILIYGSQNIEWKLKKDILSNYFDEAASKESSELIKKLEVEAISRADLVLSVSEDDANWIAEQGGKNIGIIPNGVNSWEASEKSLSEAKILSEGRAFSLYCGSAHPPNSSGFFKIFGGKFGSLKPDEDLIVAGGVGALIASDSRLYKSAKLPDKIKILGIISQECLEGLLATAHCIVLPITQGGGTNLKTAEALWAGKYVIATSVAMRGFERFMRSNGVYVEDSPAGFKRKLREVMNMPPLRLCKQDWDERQSVLWERNLSPLNELISKSFSKIWNYEKN